MKNNAQLSYKCVFSIFLLLQFLDSKSSENINVFLNSPDHTFDLKFSALFLKPGASNLGFAAEAKPIPLASPNWSIFNVCPKYSFGFDLGLRGIFHKQNTNIMMNWERFKSCHCSFRSAPVNNMVGPFFEIGPDAAFYTSALGSAFFYFNQINIDYGQMVDFGDRLHTNFFIGINVAQINQTISSFFAGTSSGDAGGAITKKITVPIEYIGAGPQCGVEFTYCIASDLHLTGKTVATILMGRLDNYTTFNSVSPLLPSVSSPTPNFQTILVQKSTQVVPEFEQNLGLLYEFDLWCDALGSIEVGYQTKIFINALQSVDLSSEVLLPPDTPNEVGVFARTFHKTLSNFSLFGPYISLDIGF